MEQHQANTSWLCSMLQLSGCARQGLYHLVAYRTIVLLFIRRYWQTQRNVKDIIRTHDYSRPMR
jgi:hypothetical protein